MPLPAPDGPTPPDGGEKHRRRPRYPGTHPRSFGEKYKELAPERYPGIEAHVRARGATPAGQHVPILVEEILTVLDPRPGERGVDATLGYGGHARRILERLAPGGRLLALDADGTELEKTRTRLGALGFGDEVLTARRTNFAALGEVLAELGWADGVDFLLADLGVSSMQIDDPARGFTFKHDGPLDMRMNVRRGISAAEFLARASEADLERTLRENSDEPRAARLSNLLLRRRGTIASTLDLARAVREALEGLQDEDEVERAVRRVFQALRIAVNDEFGVLDRLLAQIPAALRPGGRVAILTFHSGEDRRVKHAFGRGLAAGWFSATSDGVVRPSPAEQRENPRSGPAKLRWAVRGTVSWNVEGLS